MSISTKIRQAFIKLTGYYIYKKSDLPVGTDFHEDLTAKFKINPKLIFDVGANYGQTALFYQNEFKTAKIYSFEPIKNSYTKLVENCKHNENIKAFQIAFGEKEMEVEISLFSDDNSQLNSLKNINANQQLNCNKEIINVLSIDNFVLKNKIKQIDLLKIDTEGFELEVLKGATTYLKTGNVKSILCEVALTKTNKRNTQLDDIIIFLENYGFYFVGLYDTNINFYKEGLAYSNALFISKNI